MFDTNPTKPVLKLLAAVLLMSVLTSVIVAFGAGPAAAQSTMRIIAVTDAGPVFDSQDFYLCAGSSADLEAAQTGFHCHASGPTPVD
jgi:hypothetical protein